MQAWVLEGLPEIEAGADLAALILQSIRDGIHPVQDGDIAVVTSKIVSKAEGRFVAEDRREEAIAAETVRVVAQRTNESGRTTRIVQNRLGIVGAAAGVDASNTPDGTVLLLPIDPDASARALAEAFRAALGVRVGVIVSDTLGRPWRDGQTDVAIGAAGVQVFSELGGTLDSSGRTLAVTRPCLADEIAAMGDLVKGKASHCPVAIVRGLGAHVGSLDLPGARSIVRVGERDMFRLGADEAYRAGFDEGVCVARRDSEMDEEPR